MTRAKENVFKRERREKPTKKIGLGIGKSKLLNNHGRL